MPLDGIAGPTWAGTGVCVGLALAVGVPRGVAVARGLGLSAGQGYLLAVPEAAPLAEPIDIDHLIELDEERRRGLLGALF